MRPVYIEGIGVWGPGLAGWKASSLVLAGEETYSPTKLKYPAPDILPPNERRRSSEVIRLALAVSIEALGHAGQTGVDMPSVFASSVGEGMILHKLCVSLAEPSPMISPTQFHNSVHNAAAGYWSIASGSKEPSVSLSGLDNTFATGLVEAMAKVDVEGGPLLLAVYDAPMPEPLHTEYKIIDGFGVAFILAQEKTDRSLATLSIGFKNGDMGGEALMDDTRLEELRLGNPAARCLPILAAIASGRGARVELAHLEGAFWEVDVAPCR